MVLSVLPWWMRMLLHLYTLGMAPIFAAMAWREGALVGAGAALAGLTALASWVVVLRLSTTRARTSFGGGDRIEASSVVTGALLTALVAVLGAAACWTWVLLEDPAALPNPGFVLWVAVGALGCLPTLVRIITGRYHRWSLDTGPAGLGYRGGRVSRVVPWIAVGKVEVNEPGTQLTVRMAEEGGPPLTISTLLLESDAVALRDHVAAARAVHVG